MDAADFDATIHLASEERSGARQAPFGPVAPCQSPVNGGTVVSDPNLSASSPWIVGATLPGPSGIDGVRHSYPLAIRDAGLGTSIGLLFRSWPYALARFAVLLGAAIAAILWLVITVGGAVWLGTHVAHAFGWVWAVLCIAGAWFIWATALRYALHLIACGHVAVLTDLILYGKIGNDGVSMFAYGRRIVTERFGQVTALFGLNALVRGIVQAFHGTLDWIDQIVPIPGMESIASLLTMLLRAASRYLDKVIFSYSLARKDQDSWLSTREGIVYYCQNAKLILATSIKVIILERLLSLVLFIALLAPAAALTVMLPHSVREGGGAVSVLIALLFAATLRAAFVKPLFLIMIMVRFHALIEHQPINEDWNSRLAQMSSGFGSLVRRRPTT
jgi:hypothetical protein